MVKIPSIEGILHIHSGSFPSCPGPIRSSPAMDKRLPHRIREIRLQFQSTGKSCTADRALVAEGMRSMEGANKQILFFSGNRRHFVGFCLPICGYLTVKDDILSMFEHPL